MLVWLDGHTNTKAKPQENFGREIMELFTIGVGNYTEPDVYAAARVFTGWNLARPGRGGRRIAALRVRLQRRTSTTRPRRRSASRSIPTAARRFRRARRPTGCRTASISSTRSPRNPNTARYLATKLYRFFVSEFGAVNVDVRRTASPSVYLQSGYDMRAVMREVLLSPEFWDPSAYFARYSWPVEFVVRALKDIGWTGFSVERRADAAVEHGAEPLRAARRGRLGSRARRGSRPARCWRA